MQHHIIPGPALSENDDPLLVEGSAGGVRTAELPPNGEGVGRPCHTGPVCKGPLR
jgi:hypothetical protein